MNARTILVAEATTEMAQSRRPLPTLIPRNLTARADRLILGNPANSRPESGVDNCYPGLEFDKRSLDQCFFPGLRFEYHARDGAILTEVTGDQPEIRDFLTSANNADVSVYIWALGHDGDSQSVIHDFGDASGIEVWREINELPQCEVTIVLGIGPPIRPASAAAVKRIEKTATGLREDAGQDYVIVTARRSAYLDSDGVIDAAAHPPGDLTKTLCAPWMYDFRDCFCYYWAANKPDLVTDGTDADLNVSFIRSDRSGEPGTADQRVWNGRVEKELTETDFVNGVWHRLPIVLGNREQIAGPVGGVPTTSGSRLLTRSTLIAGLRHLATLEHALMVEYLYARYSLRQSMAGDNAQLPRETQALIDEAAGILLGVAVDEMRHLRWVNQLLRDFGQPISIGRARIIPEAPKPEDEATPAERRRVNMRPLTPATVQDFVDAERHSNEIGEGLDGLYVKFLVGVLDNPSEFEDCPELAPLLKLIIDEGADHFQRFLRLQEIVQELAGVNYLNQPDAHADDIRFAVRVADFAYCAIIDSFCTALYAKSAESDALFTEARNGMHQLDELASHIARSGGLFRFRLPRRIGGANDLPNTGIAKRQISRFGRLKKAFTAPLNPLIERSVSAVDALQAANLRFISAIKIDP